jgi:hypothetical protein
MRATIFAALFPARLPVPELPPRRRDGNEARTVARAYPSHRHQSGRVMNIALETTTGHLTRDRRARSTGTSAMQPTLTLAQLRSTRIPRRCSARAHRLSGLTERYEREDAHEPTSRGLDIGCIHPSSSVVLRKPARHLAHWALSLRLVCHCPRWHLYQLAPHKTRRGREPNRRTMRQSPLRHHGLVPRLPLRCAPAPTHSC